MSADQLEEKLKQISKGRRVTAQDVQDEIVEKHFVLGCDAFGVSKDHPLGLLTICCLVMKNGFTVHGMSACADPTNFNEEIGREIAERNATSVAWGHMGYELKSQLYAEAQEAQKGE